MKNPAQTVSIDEIKSFLKRCQIEANNPRNDGWVQSGYRSKIEEIFSAAEKALIQCKKK